MAFPPVRIGRYYVYDKLAVGGMAEVFKAILPGHNHFEMQVVIKRILPHLSANPDFVQMFVDEANISVKLRHQNIVQIYDFDKHLEDYFIVMECVEGCDLKTLLKKLSSQAKRLPVELVIFIAHEICCALDYAHRKTDHQHQKLGIVHRDITPANILLSYNGEVKVADFGIAKAKNKIFTTKDGVLKGKYEYMSPEQASGQSTDHRSDIFAVGILLHEMLTGMRLFKTESETATLEKVKSLDIGEPIELNRKIPPRLNKITMRALQKDPDDRFVDAKTMQLALAELLFPSSFSLISDRLSSYLNELFKDTMPAAIEEAHIASIAIQNMYKKQKDDLDLDPKDLEIISPVAETHSSKKTTNSLFQMGLAAVICIQCIIILILIV
ncbi:MAG: hypothetical protein CMK59_10695 [Proteobacteria bacterium]|nr:hypothetical protein [Pseudomonadota bacterium]